MFIFMCGECGSLILCFNLHSLLSYRLFDIGNGSMLLIHLSAEYRCLDRLADRFGEFTVVRASAASPLVPRSHGFLHKTAKSLDRGAGTSYSASVPCTGAREG